MKSEEVIEEASEKTPKGVVVTVFPTRAATVEDIKKVKALEVGTISSLEVTEEAEEVITVVIVINLVKSD